MLAHRTHPNYIVGEAFIIYFRPDGRLMRGYVLVTRGSRPIIEFCQIAVLPFINELIDHRLGVKPSSAYAISREQPALSDIPDLSKYIRARLDEILPSNPSAFKTLTPEYPTALLTRLKWEVPKGFVWKGNCVLRAAMDDKIITHFHSPHTHTNARGCLGDDFDALAVHLQKTLDMIINHDSAHYANHRDKSRSVKKRIETLSELFKLDDEYQKRLLEFVDDSERSSEGQRECRTNEVATSDESPIADGIIAGIQDLQLRLQTIGDLLNHNLDYEKQVLLLLSRVGDAANLVQTAGWQFLHLSLPFTTNSMTRSDRKNVIAFSEIINHAELKAFLTKNEDFDPMSHIYLGGGLVFDDESQETFCYLQNETPAIVHACANDVDLFLDLDNHLRKYKIPIPYAYGLRFAQTPDLPLRVVEKFLEDFYSRVCHIIRRNGKMQLLKEIFLEKKRVR